MAKYEKTFEQREDDRDYVRISVTLEGPQIHDEDSDRYDRNVRQRESLLRTICDVIRSFDAESQIVNRLKAGK